MTTTPAPPAETGHRLSRRALLQVQRYGAGSLLACAGLAACVHGDVDPVRLQCWLALVGALGLVAAAAAVVGVRRTLPAPVRRWAEGVAAVALLVQGLLVGALPLLLPGRADRTAVDLVYVLVAVALAAALPPACSASRVLFLAGPVPLLAVSGLIVTAGGSHVPRLLGPLELLLLGVLMTARLDRLAGFLESAANAAALSGLAGDLAVERERTAAAQEQVAWATDALTHHVGHDPLTGLANQGSFHEHLTLALARGRRSGSHVAVLFVDLDGLRRTIFGVGQIAGDRLLVLAAERCRHATRDGDWVARHGGDEFTVLLPGVAFAQDALMVAERVHAAMAQPFDIDGLQIQLSASVGVALDGTHTDGPDDLLRYAEAALSRAKDLGGNRIEMFHESMRQALKRQLQAEDDRCGALAAGQTRPDPAR